MHLSHQYAFVLLLDTKERSPGNDPDAGVPMRLTATGRGLITGAALERQVRQVAKKNPAPHQNH